MALLTGVASVPFNMQARAQILDDPMIVPKVQNSRTRCFSEGRLFWKSVGADIGLFSDSESNKQGLGHLVRAFAESTSTSIASVKVQCEKLTIPFNEDNSVFATVDMKRGTNGESYYEVHLGVSSDHMTLHWAANNWSLPSQSWWPTGSVQATANAVETPFTSAAHKSWEVSLVIPENEAPHRLVFVLRDDNGAWYNNDGCFEVPLKPLDIHNLVERVVKAETSSTWSLFNRFILASELLDSSKALGAAGMSLMFTWLRLSALKQLAWYKNCNYQAKDIAHVQKSLATSMAHVVKHAKDPMVKLLARMALGTLPRGGGNADEIRMGILHIMREHGIQEGHRPGIVEQFLEQWHQKLHTNTSPEDIHICEAYLHFLRTNSSDNFYRTLWDNGRITREWLANMDHPITAHPVYLPQLIPAFEHFLWVLKVTHSGADLDVMTEMSKGYMDGNLKGTLYDILANRDAWWVPGRIVDARKQLRNVLQNSSTNRDILLLDIALSNFFGISVARIDKSSLSGDDLCGLILLVLEEFCINGENEELSMCLKYWGKVTSTTRWTVEWSLTALAAIDRISLALEDHMDAIYKLVQPHAEALGTACGIKTEYISNFGEEVIRGQVLFNLSSLLQKLQPMLQRVVGLNTWQITSHRPSAEGKLLVVPTLASIQGHSYDEPHVVVTSTVGGMEDIPHGVTAVLSLTPIDVLSHVAIRARNCQVLVASCSDVDVYDDLKRKEGETLTIKMDASGQLIFSEGQLSALDINKDMLKETEGAKVIPTPIEDLGVDEWVVPEWEFKTGKVGKKSFNIAELRKRLENPIMLPSSVALPFGVFERVIGDELNIDVRSAFLQHVKMLASASEFPKSASEFPKVSKELAAIRDLVSNNLSVPQKLEKQFSEVIRSINTEVSIRHVWQAICRVWASKWTDRAWLSRQSQSISDNSLHMACLLQMIFPAEYSFVVHTVHPITKDRSTMFVEVVKGLGEVLVSNHKGRAFSFSVSKNDTTQRSILSFPSKGISMTVPEGTLIARSDSNGEDLEGFAGAGLYESVASRAMLKKQIDYSEERLLWDADFRDKLVQDICMLSLDVEKAFGGQPQDIEGLYFEGKYAVVQSRPQII